MKKSFFLFLALILPVSIFMFLRYFGKNKFDLPILMKDATEWPQACVQPESYPFQASSDLSNQTKPVLLILDSLSAEAVKRLSAEIDSTGVKLLTYYPDPALNSFPDCLSRDRAFSALLLDTLGRVRGLYTNLDRDETDRIIVETKILTGKY